MQRLFVYGTLAPGQPNHGVLSRVPGTWEAATLKGILLDEGWGAAMGCAGIVPTDHGKQVEGFVFSSTELVHHWARLDAFEGEGYRRVPVVATLTATKQKVSTYVYQLNRDNLSTAHTAAE